MTEDSVDVIARKLPGKWQFKPITLWATAWMKENLVKTSKGGKTYLVDEGIGNKAFRAMLDAGMILREETW